MKSKEDEEEPDTFGKLRSKYSEFPLLPVSTHELSWFLNVDQL